MGLITEDRISDIVVVRDLDLIEQDHIFKLRRISHDRALTDDGISADKCTVAHLCIFSDDRRTVDKCRRSDFR